MNVPTLTRRSDGKVFRIVIQARSLNGPVTLVTDDATGEIVHTTNDRLIVNFIDSRDAERAAE